MTPHADSLRVLNPDALREIRELEEPGETSFLAETVDSFRASSASDLARLTRALDARDHETVLLVAHRIKGVAATMGADRMAAIAQALELCGRQRSLAGGAEQLEALKAARWQALAALGQEVALGGG
jgi:HPt (histidine-containing phosphotransfer) domain-containing protein